MSEGRRPPFQILAAWTLLFFATGLAAHGQVGIHKQIHYKIELPAIDWGALAALLPQEGPQVVETTSGAVDARGFLAGGWPVAIAFELAQKGTLAVRIGTEKELEVFTFAGKKNKREIVKIEIPKKEFGPSIQAGRVSARAFDKNGDPIDFQIYGIGVGRRAVGSLMIEKVNFGPERILTAVSEEAAYGFVSRADFESTRVDILRQRYLAAEKRFENTLVHQRWVDCERKRPCEDRWNGMTTDGKPSPGSHLLQVTAFYRTPARGQHWTFVRSPDRVEVDPE